MTPAKEDVTSAKLWRFLPVLWLLVAVATAVPASGAGQPAGSPAGAWSVELKLRNYFASHSSYEFGNPYLPNQAPLSRLEFPLNSWWAGAEMRRSFPRFSVGIEALRNVSGEAGGKMKDSDWDDDARPDVMTIYSESDCRIAPSYTVRGDVDLKIDWKALPAGFDLRPVLGFRWQRFSFVSHDGTQVYPAPGDTTPPIALPGDGIRFEQTYRHLFLGVRMAYDWPGLRQVRRLTAKVQLDWAYVTGDNEDHHLLRTGRRFTYESTRGDGWHASAGLNVGLTERLSATLEADYLMIRTKGSHRLVNSTFGTDMGFDHGVEAYSDQASLTAGLRYAF